MGFKSPQTADFTHNLLSAIHPDTVPASPVKGDLIYGNSTPAWARLGIGAANQILGVSGGVPTWSAQSYIDHGALTGLTDDDHTQYALLAGRTGTNDFTGRITADSLHVGGTSAPGDNNLTVDGVIGIGVTPVGGIDVYASRTRDAAPVQFEAVNLSTNAGGGTQARLVLKNSAKECQIVLTSVNADSLGIGTSGYTFYYFDGTGPFVYYLNGDVRLSIQAGVHVGGTSDPGNDNLLVDGTVNAATTLQVGGKSFSFGANDSAGAGYRTVKIENA